MARWLERSGASQSARLVAREWREQRLASMALMALQRLRRHRLLRRLCRRRNWELGGSKVSRLPERQALSQEREPALTGALQPVHPLSLSLLAKRRRSKMSAA